MTEQPLDPWREKLIALLYGELTSEEERELRNRLSEDDTLRSEWEELQATRVFLGAWDLTGEAPSFLFPGERSLAQGESPGPLGRWRSRLKGLLAATPWAVAAASIALAVLAVNDFRIERSDGSYALRIGKPTAAPTSRAPSVDPAGGGGLPLAGRPDLQGEGQQANSVEELLAIPGLSPFVTREEFEAYAVGMTQTIVTLLNEYGRQRDGELAVLLNATLTNLVEMQDEGYRELRNRIEAVQLGLEEEQISRNVQVDYLMQENQPGLMAPTSHSPADGPEGVEK